MNFDSQKPCGIPEIKILDQHFKDYQLMILDANCETMYLDTEKDCHKFIYLINRYDHFDCILSMKAFYGISYYCDYCKKGFNNRESHRCRYTCKVCFRINCDHEAVIKCKSCNKYCRNKLCYELHTEHICHKLKICSKCKQQQKYKTHVCINEKWCKNCKESVDIEIKWALQQTNTVQIAHNMKGYDGIFILNYLINNMKPSESKMPSFITNGIKILSLEFRSIKIIDSAVFLPIPLEKFPKTFDIHELKKGFFPHIFNKPENYNYVGVYPEQKYYKPEFFTVKKKSDFEAW